MVLSPARAAVPADPTSFPWDAESSPCPSQLPADIPWIYIPIKAGSFSFLPCPERRFPAGLGDFQSLWEHFGTQAGEHGNSAARPELWESHGESRAAFPPGFAAATSQRAGVEVKDGFCFSREVEAGASESLGTDPGRPSPVS